jgi:hypothetical protein
MYNNVSLSITTEGRSISMIIVDFVFLPVAVAVVEIIVSHVDDVVMVGAADAA